MNLLLTKSLQFSLITHFVVILKFLMCRKRHEFLIASDTKLRPPLSLMM